MAKWNIDKLCRPKKYMGQIMAECDCQHQACDARGYCMADRIEELEDEVVRLSSHLQWIYDGAHTRGHTLPDIKERAGIALAELKGEDRG